MILNQKDIQNYILHRHENLLIDTVKNNTLTVKITKNDPLNRSFFITNYNSTPQLTTTIAMEILALGGIVSGGKKPPGKMVIFAGILNFKLITPLPINQEITGHCKKVSDKGGFIKYRGTLTCNDTLLAQGEMLAFITEESTTNDTPKKLESIPEISTGNPIQKDASYKNPFLYIIDEYINDTQSTCLTKYTFPSTHPLTKGHFPKRPIMMGVLQWLSIEDACRYYALQNYKDQNITITGNAILFKSDASLVAEIKQFEVQVKQQHTTVALLVGTKRISFRQMIQPEDTIYTYLTDISIT